MQLGAELGTEPSLYQWYKPKSLFFMFPYRNTLFFSFFLFSFFAPPPLHSIPADSWYLPGSGCVWPLQHRVHSPGHRAGAAICPPGKSPAQGGWSPVLFLSGVQHGAKKYPKKPMSPHLIPSSGSLSLNQIGNVPSHKPLQECFGQEVRNDGFIPDVL